MIRVVKESWGRWLPFVFMVVAALTRWPGLFLPNFSAFYALAFCAGAFFPSRMKWWLPLGTLLVTDLALNFFYYHVAPQTYQLVNYVAYAGLILFGSRFSHKSRFLHLLAGGIIGALVFYFLTNTAAWLFNPFRNAEYTKDLTGWIRALTLGIKGHP